MPFEELDKKIREAAEQHHPAYDEKAWAKMEKLLDKHLPHEKKRRRFVLWLFPFMIAAGSAVFLFRSQYNETGIPGVTFNENTTQELQIKKMTAVDSLQKGSGTILYKKPVSQIVLPGDYDTQNPEKIELNASEWQPVSKPSFAGNAKNAISKTMPVQMGFSSKTEPAGLQKSLSLDELIEQKAVVAITDISPAITNVNEPELPDNAIKENKKWDVISSQKETDTLKDQTVQINSGTADSLPADINRQLRSVPLIIKPEKKANTFFIAASLAPDVSFVGGNQLGKMKLVSGFGIGYSFRNKWTLRTGFYSGRKIYTASGAAYNPPQAFYQYYPILEKADADCKLFEIPLMVSYHFRRLGAGGWFVSAGLSTLLMKTETYDYAYKYNATGPTYYKTRTISNENNHYFSLMTFSGGYQRNIGKRLFIMAEPYFKLPLSGVGFGKVKLNSSGVLLSAGYKLSGQKKK